MGFPSLGSWVTYGLGSVSDNLPAYCVMLQPEGSTSGGAPCWGMRSCRRRTREMLRRGGTDPQPQATGRCRQRAAAAHARSHRPDESARSRSRRHGTGGSHRIVRSSLSACKATLRRRLTPARNCGNAGSLRRRRKRTNEFRLAPAARARLVERGVRFVQLYSGGGPIMMQWDAHDDTNLTHEKMCGFVDKPIAALLKDS